MNNERWIDIKGYEGLYQVSNLGRVKSLRRTKPNGQTVIERILKESDNVVPKLIIIQNTNKDYEKENDTIFPITKINTDMDNILNVFL